MHVSKTKMDFLYQLMYRMLTIITPLITSPYLSRVLGVSNMGIYSATYAVVNYFTLIAMLGVEMYGSRCIASCKNDRDVWHTFSDIYIVQLMSSMISFIVYYLTVFIYGGDRFNYLLAQGIWIIAMMLDINWVFFGLQEFKVTSLRNFFVKLLTILLIFVFVKSEDDLLKYILIMTLCAVINQVIMWGILLKKIKFTKPRIKYFRIHLKSMVRLFVPVAAMSIYHIMDKTMVDLLSDEINGGCYYSADRLVNIPLGMVTAIGTVMLPKMTKLICERNSNYKNMLVKSGELTICMIAAIAFGLGAISSCFVPVFFGPGYELCVLLIKIFIPVLIIKALGEFIRQQYLIPNSRDGLYIIAVCCGAVINLVANFIMISRWGAIGAVLGTLVAETTVLIIEMVWTKKEIDYKSIILNNSIYLIFGMVMYLVINYIDKKIVIAGIPKLIVLITIGIFIYTISCCVYCNYNSNSIFHIYLNKKRKSKYE